MIYRPAVGTGVDGTMTTPDTAIASPARPVGGEPHAHSVVEAVLCLRGRGCERQQPCNSERKKECGEAGQGTAKLRPVGDSRTAATASADGAQKIMTLPA
ncbi:hypothetical protein GCM10007874_50920 [Labrys miyagiensis]|uniref:Uncharacterized protein n=1 Tax=Labrys miyagiensis TaxID=346912 RepID=A0ABQ6CSW7_9HYPH|nr:hypothetical protein GCM10007874_50920 [Labrys miyagiensis]